jgi:LacI family transcriptional regulator
MKTVTIKDVAKEAGVSISVVSYVLNNNPNVSISKETRDKVIHAAQKLNYTPNSIARSMRTKKSMIIGLATFWDVSDSVFTDALKAIDSISEKHGYSVTYINIKDRHKGNKIVELFKRSQIDGVIMLSHVDPAKSFNEQEVINRIKKNKIPAVVIDGSTEDPDISYVYIDYFGTSYTAVNHLYKYGHRKFCYMLPDKKELSSRQAVQRIEGYKEALRDLNLSDSNIYFDINSMQEIIDLIKSEKADKPTAVIVNKTRYAAVLLRAFGENNIKVPDDISVIACNDQNFADFLTPPLTTIKVPIYEIGVKSGEILFDILKGRSLNVKLKLSNEVVERGSFKKLQLS